MHETTRERRRFDRVISDKPLEILHGSGRDSGRLLDISLRGALFELAGDWRPGSGEQIHLRVRLDDDNCCIEMDGEVAHQHDRHVGMHCSTLDLDSAARLRRMVELNLADPELLERNLQEMVDGGTRP